MKYIFILFLLALIITSCKEEKSTPESSDAALTEAPKVKLSLAEWSFHKALFGNEMSNLEFAAKAASLGFEGLEYVNQFFPDKATNMAYLDSMKAAANAAGVKSLLIMIDREGYLGDLDSTKRNEAVENHKKWVDAAAYLGCHSIRVNAHGEGSAEEVAAAATDGLHKICLYAAGKNINVIVENHGGYSSDGNWLSNVMKQVNLPNCGTLPDFGNFCIKREGGDMYSGKCIDEYDKYKGVEEMMPYAKALSAKAFDFDENGNEVSIDFAKMYAIAKNAGYDGYWGVEYEGENLGEEEGIIKTRDLILKVAGM